LNWSKARPRYIIPNSIGLERRERCRVLHDIVKHPRPAASLLLSVNYADASSSRSSLAPSTRDFILPFATSRGRYFIPQSGATMTSSAATYGSARRMRAATTSGVSTRKSARSMTPRMIFLRGNVRKTAQSSPDCAVSITSLELVSVDDQVVAAVPVPGSCEIYSYAQVPRPALSQVRPSPALIEDSNVTRELIALAAQRCDFNPGRQYPPNDEERDARRDRSETDRPEGHARVGGPLYPLQGLDRSLSLRLDDLHLFDKRPADLISHHRLQPLRLLIQLPDGRFSELLLPLSGLHEEAELHAVLVHGYTERLGWSSLMKAGA
jgi:hypothetical protein